MRYYVILISFIFLMSQGGRAEDVILEYDLKKIFEGYCSTPNQEAGKCVIYNDCNFLTKPLTNEDFVNFQKWNKESMCSPTEICCSFKDLKSEKNVISSPDVKGCGRRNPDGLWNSSKATEENESKPGEFPWTIIIFKKANIDGAVNNMYVGGGSLIHPNVVLTAAHVVNDQRDLTIRAGEWDVSSKDILPHQDRDVDEIVIHSEFGYGNLVNNIALLFLKQPVELATNVGLVCLPLQDGRASGGSRCFASGWGKNKSGKDEKYQDIMKKVEVPVIDNDKCQEKLRKTRLSRFFKLHSSFMCAGGETGKDTCEGDGGSPLVCPIEDQMNRYMQSGIVAWGISCGEDDTPAVYTDVASFREWIDRKLADRKYDTTLYTY